MPFNELQRRDSWPPTIVRIQENSNPTDIENIDENPISFFLTTPEDLELFEDDLEDLSAGIEGSPESKALPIREVSPSALQRSPLPELEDMEDIEDGKVEFGVGMPLSLKDFTAHHITSKNNGRKSRLDSRTVDESLKGLGIEIPEFKAKRGRPKVRLTPNHGRGRGKTRSLSARRPQSWRVPSPSIYSIEEEKEEDVIEADRDMGLSVSAPATTQIEQAVMLKKVKKRVHWAI